MRPWTITPCFRATLSDLLHQQGRELQSFWETGKDEDAARYENVRKDSWAAISRLLGIGR